MELLFTGKRTLLGICIAVCCIIRVSSVDLYDYGSGVGDSTLANTNDIAIEVALSQGLPFYNKLYNKVFINENGLISMLVSVEDATEKQPLPIDGEPDSDDPRVLIAPFWANVDVTEGGNVFYRQVSGADDALTRATDDIRQCFVTEFDFTAKHGVVVTWDDVSFFGHESVDQDPRNTFQLVLVSDGSESFALFLYESITWNAGTESSGDKEYGKGDRGASIGFNSGDLYKFFTHSRSSGNAEVQTALDQFENCPSLGDGAYIYKIDGDSIIESGCKNDADLTIFPSIGSMFGGEEIFLVGPCWDSQAQIECQFLYNNMVVQSVTGTVLSQEGAVCVPEPFFLSGELKLEVSVDAGANFVLGQVYTVVNLDRMSSTGVTRVNPSSENWHASDYPLEVQWDSDKFDANANNISITVLAYLEDLSAGPRWEEVYHIAESTANDGSYDFEGVATSSISEQNAFGAIRIHDMDKPNGLKLWSGMHTFGYILNQEYQDNPRSWSRTMCDRWAEDENDLPDFVDNLIPCPCTLQQAIVDTGRFQPDTGCSMYAGSVCTYHVGAKHCVRSVAASDYTNSGTQCCYGDNGDLVYAGDSDQGSTADRSHVWGAEPYQAIDMVPGLSHWKHDVITFYYCCLWGDDCKTYLTLRPTADCKEYSPPRGSTAFGDPHFVTFDDLPYTFNGKGEWTLLEIPSYAFELQGRTEQATCQSCGVTNNTEGEPQQATSLTAVAMTEMNTDTIHVELNPITTLKFVRRYSGVSEVIAFNGQVWLDFNGVSIVVVEADGSKIEKATITFWNSGTGVNVTANGQMLAVAVTLPPALENNVADVRGLFGNWDNSTTNDFIDRNGDELDPDTATPYDIMDFGLTWEIEASLFYYESGGQHSDYQDSNFVPLYDAPDLSTLPLDLQQDIERICGDMAECIYDMSLTRSTDVGEYTIEAMDFNKLTNMYTEPLVACPFIPTPRNGSKLYQTEQENNLLGAHIVFTCDERLTLTGPEERICQENGQWTGEGDNDCVATGCSPLTSPKNGYIDIIYENGVFVAETVCNDGYSLEGSGRRTCTNGKWSGKAATCIGGLSPGAKTGIILGVLISIALVLLIVGGVVIWSKKHTGTSDLDKGTKVKEVGGGENWGMEAEVADATAANVETGKHETSVVDT